MSGYSGSGREHGSDRARLRTTTRETAEYTRPMEQAVSGADDEFTAAGFGINDAEEGDTDLFALDNPAEDGGD